MGAGIACAILSTGCVTATQQMQTALAEGDPAGATRTGKAWLAEHPDDRGGPNTPAERRRVKRLLLEAEFATARQRDTADAYVMFVASCRPAALCTDLVEEAARAESAAYYRDVTRRADDARAYAAFVEKYPDAAEAPEARRRQLDSARRALAQTRSSAEALAQFRATYADWPEAAEAVAEARGWELALALAQAERESERVDRPEIWSRLQREYGAWPEFQPYRAEILQREASVAVARARERDTADALREVIERYGARDEVASQMPALRARAVELAFMGLVRGQWLADWKRFLSQYGSYPEAADRLPEARGEVVRQELRQLQPSTRLDDWRAFRQSYGAWPEFAPVQAEARASEARLVVQELVNTTDTAGRERLLSSYPGWPELAPAHAALQEAREESAWQQALAADSRAGWKAFIGSFPSSRRITEATRRWRALEPEDGSSLGVRFNSVERLPDGRLRAFVEVLDTDAQPVGGLDAPSFQFTVDGTQVCIDGFEGVDDARPIDLVFVIDTTGSMSEEIDGVKRAAIDLAEDLALRNRDARFGLVAFGDEVRGAWPSASGPLSSNVRDFQRHVATLTATGGGDADENPLDALVVARGMRFRPGAQVLLVLLTDAGAHQRDRVTRLTSAGLAADLSRRQTALYAIAPNVASFAGLTRQLGGMLRDITQVGDFSKEMLEMGTRAAKQYRLTFRLSGETPLERLRARVRREQVWQAGDGRQITVSSSVRLPDGAQVGLAGEGLLARRRAEGDDWQVENDGPRLSSLALLTAAKSRALIGVESSSSRLLLRSLPMEGSEWRPHPDAGRVDAVAVSEGASFGAVLKMDGALWRLGSATDKLDPLPPIPDGRVARTLWFEPSGGTLRAVGEDGSGWELRTPSDAWTSWMITSPAPGLSTDKFRFHQHAQWPGLLLATDDLRRLFRSVDGGRTWQQVGPSDVASSRSGCASGPPGTVDDIAFDAPNGQLIARVDNRLSVSLDWGLTWAPLKVVGFKAREKLRLQTGADGEVSLVDSGGSAPVQRRQIKDREFVASSIYFPSGGDAVSPRLSVFLDRLAAKLRGEELSVLVEGHTDDVGAEESNVVLSERRAHAVVRELSARGVDESRMRWVGHGEERPRAPGVTAAARARNRRVELTIMR